MGSYVFNPWTAELDRVASNDKADTVLVNSEANALGASTETTVADYTATDKTRISRIIIAGQVYAKWRVTLNGSTQIAKLYSGPDRARDFVLNIDIANTDIIRVLVEHFYTGDTFDFNATILGR